MDLKSCREKYLIGRTELARQAGLSVLTIDRIEKGKGCHRSTKEKIIKALEMLLAGKEKNSGTQKWIRNLP